VNRRVVPLILIESPRWTSSRIGPTSVIVAEYPSPPESDVSLGSNSEMVPRCSTAVSSLEGWCTYSCEHGVASGSMDGRKISCEIPADHFETSCKAWMEGTDDGQAS
jgi:hypothetical protein